MTLHHTDVREEEATSELRFNDMGQYAFLKFHITIVLLLFTDESAQGGPILDIWVELRLRYGIVASIPTSLLPPGNNQSAMQKCQSAWCWCSVLCASIYCAYAPKHT